MPVQVDTVDYRKLANEDDVRAAVRAGSPAPGQYIIPYCSDPKEFEKPEMMQKLLDGPVGVMMLRQPCAPKMGRCWAAGSGSTSRSRRSRVISHAACFPRRRASSASAVSWVRVTFVAYAAGPVSQAIWWGKPWSSASKELLDAFIYALVSALAFAALWPAKPGSDPVLLPA
jgi:hypothetical protein